MRILLCGDVVGSAGREAVTQHIPDLRKRLGLDCVVVNGENAAGGFGVTKKICDGFMAAGADVITGGDHIFDQKETASFIGQYPTLLRPANFPEKVPGKGVYLFTTAEGKTVLVLHLLAQLFMKYSLDCPFAKATAILNDYRLGKTVDAIVVDFHGEATSEKMAMGHHLDGKVSLVVGSHTHVPTADTQILPGGTALQTDAGMCGDYNSVIGFNPKIPLKGFVDKMKTERLQPAEGEATLCGVCVETDDATGLAKHVAPVRVGGRLAPQLPDWI